MSKKSRPPKRPSAPQADAPADPASDKQARGKGASSRPAELEELEARVLLSTWTLQDAGENGTGEAIEQQISAEEIARLAMRDENQTFDLSSGAESETATQEIVFVDAGVEGYDRLLVDLFGEDDTTSRSIEVIVLSEDRDGLEQITEALADRTEIDAIHLIAHGEDGSVQLGDGYLDAASLTARRDEIEGWSTSLREDADILIYGCDLASTNEGKSLVTSLADLTGADIAASTDLTGAAALGGDWDLEYRVGEIEAATLEQDAWHNNWVGTLDIESGLVAHYLFDEGSGSVAIDEAGGDDTGTLSGTPAPSRVTGILGEALEFADGGDDILTVADSANLDFGSGDFTVSYWYNTSTTPTSQARIVRKLDSGIAPGFVTFADSANDINLVVSDGTSSVALNGTGEFDGEWHLFTAVRTGNLFELYVDGSLIDSETLALGSIDNAEILTMGGSTGAPETYDGKLDEVRLYDRALSSSDVTELFNTSGSLTYPESNGANNYFEWITGVSFAGINNTTVANAGGYGDYTGQTGTVEAGSTYDLTVNINSDSQDYVNAWFDWNRDGDFTDAGETYTVVANTGSNGPHTISIDVPAGATLGNTVMRVSVSYQSAPSSEGVLSFGEVEDYTINILAAPVVGGENEAPTAVDDTVNVDENGSIILDLTANDTDPDGDPITVAEFTQPSNGTVVDNGDGTVTYTPSSGYTGADSFDYVAIDSGSGVQHYWGLDGGVQDAIGGADGVLYGTSPVAADVGSGLAFDDSTEDYALIPDVSYGSEFTMSFDFKVDGNSGTLFQYLYSHGDVNATNSLNVFLNEASHGTDPNVLRTVLRDSDDTLDNVALQIDATSLIGTGWHTYTVSAGADGIEVFIDGVSVATDATRGTGSFDPAGGLYLGAREDLGADRFFGGALDSLRIYDSALEADEVSAIASGQNVGTVNITVDAENDAPTFSVGDGVAETTFEGLSAALVDVVIQPDGKLVGLASANTAESGQDIDYALVRYNTDGTLDTSFGTDGYVYNAVTANNELPASILLQPDGKILVAGGYSPTSSLDSIIMRYDTNGDLDTSFAGDGMLTFDVSVTSTDYIEDMVLQDDGGIVVTGYATFSGDEQIFAARIDSNGVLDTTFDGDGVRVLMLTTNDDRGNAIALQPDGKILIAGQSENGTDRDLVVLRLNVDGSDDTSFNGDGVFAYDGGNWDTAQAITVDAGGRIVVGGLSYGTSNYDSVVLRLNPDGELDENFGTTGISTVAAGSPHEQVDAIAIQADGKIVVAGSAYNGSNNDLSIFRLDVDGQLDSSFDGDGLVRNNLNGATDAIKTLVIDEDGTIIVAGNTSIDSAGTAFIARYGADGALIQEFALVNTLDGNPTFIEGGDAVVLDADVQILDSELSAADNFDGASLTIARNGGASSDDVFTSSGTLLTLTQGSNNLTVDGVTIGSVTVNTAGSLTLTFNGNATNALVNSAMRQIAYSNTSETPPAIAVMNWTFDDGNVTSQGSGGAKTATGSTTVLIAPDPSPTHISSGIELNTDGGNDAYLIADDGGTILGGLTSLTVEVNLTLDNSDADAPHLFSYSIAGEDHEARAYLTSGNNLIFGVGGDVVLLDNVSDLVDGAPHSVSISWDNTSGDAKLYIDGEYRGSGIVAAGHTIGANGALTIGQGSPSSGKIATQAFHGELYDFRIWSEARTNPEIELSHQQKYDSASLPAGLVANWQMDGLTGADSTQIVDVVSGNNLSIAQVGEIRSWTNPTGGVSADGNTLTYVHDDGQADGWTSQINSDNLSTLGFTDDYTVRFTLDNTTNFAWTVGLGSTETNSDYTDPEYAIFVDHIGGQNDVDVRHNGTTTGTYSVNYAPGGEFGFYVNGTTLEYQYDGVTFATDTITANIDWYIDNSFYVRTSDSAYNNQDDYSLSNFHIVEGTGDAATGFTASTVIGDLHVSENAGDGARVGFVMPSDPDAPEDIVNDGLFTESGDQGTSPGFTRYNSSGADAGSALGEWTVAAGDVDTFTRDWTTAPGGGVVIDLNGSTAGVIEQTLSTEPGRQYQIIFEMSGDFAVTGQPANLRVSADGESSDFSMEEPDNFVWGSGGAFNPYSMTFTADDASTTLQLASLDSGVSGPYISNVRVIEIPQAIGTILNDDSTLDYDAATGKFYRLVDTGSFFDDALAAATGASLNGVSGQLVTIRSAYENELIQQYAVDSGQDIWLGTIDTNNDGNWHWLDGDVESENQFWTGGSGGSPAPGAFAPAFGQSEATGEDYARIQADGTWADDNEPSSLAYVIEWDASEVLSSYTFSLDNDADGRFAINESTGEITVADGSKIDYEDATSHDIQIRTTDAGGASYVETMSIAVDDAIDPIQSVPGPQTINEDEVLTFSNANGNTVTVSDSDDSTNSRLQVFLSVDNGSLTLAQTTGISILGGSNGSYFMTLQGTEADLNAAFEGMTFTPNADYVGSVTLNMTTSFNADMQGHYTFEGGSLNDQSAGLSQQGAIVGDDTNTTTTDAERGDVLSLDGSGHYVEIPGMFSNPTDVTLSAWINPNLGSDQEVISLGDNIALRVNTTGTLSALYYGASGINWLTTSETLSVGWSHIALTFDDAGDSFRLYIDGIQVNSSVETESIVYGRGTETTIGYHGFNESAFAFDGLIDDARIYDRALSAAEITAIATENSESSATVAITVESVNDAPNLNHISDDYLLALNNGNPLSLDAVRAFEIFDSDSSNFDGGTLTLTGNGFVSGDLLSFDTSGAVSLSAGLSDGSVLSVSGTAIGTLTGTSTSGLTLTLNSDSTIERVETAVQSLRFESTASVFGSRSIDLILVDGDGVADGGTDTGTASIVVNVASSENGTTTATESTAFTYGPSDFDFTGVVGTELRDITITALPSAGSLQLGGAPVVTGQTISYAELDAGDLTFLPAGNDNGADYASFEFYVNSGNQSVNVLPGEFSSYNLDSTYLTSTDLILSNTANFGPSGTYPANIQFESTDSTIDAAYLAQGEIYFGGYVSDGSLDAGELATLDTWVSAGGIIISTNDGTSYDSIAEHFGLVIGGSASSTWEIESSGNSIINGPFGSVGNSGDTIRASGSISYFDSASLAAGDVVIAQDSASGEPTIVLREQGDGWILFTGDEGIFRTDMSGDGIIATANDILAANIFAWAVDSAPKTTMQMDISVDGTNDAPVINRTNLISNGDLASGDLTGWTTTGTVSNSGDALRFGQFDDAGPHTASQSFTTVVGESYTLNFSYRDDSGSLNQQMQVTVDGATNVLTRTQNSSTAGTGYLNYTFSFVADSTTSTLSFTDSSSSSASVDGYIDNVSVVQQASFTPITEDDTHNAGDTVASIIGSVSGDLITDADTSDPEGIAIVDASWAFDYSLDGGSTWRRIETVSTTNALLLRATDLVRFVPNEIASQSEEIEFRAWDQTTGAAGTYASTSTNGGSSAFSTDIETASIITTDDNDTPTFGSESGVAVGYGESGYNQNVASLALSDGSVLFTPYDENYTTVIGKLGPDGQLDTSFGNDGYFDPSSIEYIRDIKKQSDGKFLVVGDIYPDVAVARYNADGTLDVSFGTGGVVNLDSGFDDGGYEVAVHTDGSIVVVGEAGNDSLIAKYTSAGVLDVNFDGNSGTGDGIVTVNLGGTNERLGSVTILPDGRILAAGENHVIRLTTTGVLDPSFDGDGILDVGHKTNSLVVQANGDIAVTGLIGDDLVVSRFDADGSLDTGFGTGGTT
ncbi:MAG: LamG-like jellyroll fold domain-containing protein, partial [Myxococcota bacterium]